MISKKTLRAVLSSCDDKHIFKKKSYLMHKGQVLFNHFQTPRKIRSQRQIRFEV